MVIHKFGSATYLAMCAEAVIVADEISLSRSKLALMHALFAFYKENGTPVIASLPIKPPPAPPHMSPV
jgi:hypothetical protein